MADLQFDKSAEDERLLLLSFDNGKPLSATQVASILRAMDADYYSLYGRELVLARLEVGSTWIWLTEKAIAAASVLQQTSDIVSNLRNLGTFAAIIRDALKPKPPTVALVDAPVPEDWVRRTALAVTKVAGDTDAAAHLRASVKTTVDPKTGIRTTEGKIDFKILPKEAKQRRKEIRSRSKKLASPGQLPSPIEYSKIAQEFRSLPPITDDTESLIRAIVQAHLIWGSASILKRIADTLAGEGRQDIADSIRRHLGRSDGTVRITDGR